MSVALELARTELAAAARALAADGLVRGTSGNLSVRVADQVAVSPTGGVLATLTADQVTLVDLDGTVRGALEPTSELGLHLELYARYGAGAVVHTHAPAATAVGLLVDELPAIHYEMLALGGAVRVAPYATFGTPELATAAADALEGRTAVLLANHGTITLGDDLAGAVRATELLEWASALYLRAAAAGTPRALGPDELQAVADTALARGYGVTRTVRSAGAQASS